MIFHLRHLFDFAAGDPASAFALLDSLYAVDLADLAKALGESYPASYVDQGYSGAHFFGIHNYFYEFLFHLCSPWYIYIILQVGSVVYREKPYDYTDLQIFTIGLERANIGYLRANVGESLARASAFFCRMMAIASAIQNLLMFKSRRANSRSSLS